MIVYTSAVLCASLLAAFVWSVQNLRVVLEAKNDAFLRHELGEFAALVENDIRNPASDSVAEELRRESAMIEEAGMLVVVRRRGAVEVYPETAEARDLAAALDRAPLDETPQTVAAAGPGIRAVRLVTPASGAESWTVDIGLRLAATEQTVASFVRRLAGGGALFVLAAVGGSFWLVQRAVSPVAAGIAAAQQLNPDDLSTRLPRTGAGDEVDRLAATINELLERLSRYHERAVRFTADASHELRGPLAAMRAAVEVTLQQPRPADEYREALGSLGEQCQRLTDLVNKLLLLARADTGQIELQHEEVDLDSVVAEAVDTYRPLAEEKRIGVEWQSRGSVACQGDRMRLQQLVMNLLDNAIKFNSPGGTVKVALAAERASARLTVEDDGIGISPDHLGQVFERFFQADESRSGSGGGLGLSICRWVAGAHGGSIDVASQPGRGTCFTVTLPRSGVVAGRVDAGPETAQAFPDGNLRSASA